MLIYSILHTQLYTQICQNSCLLRYTTISYGTHLSSAMATKCNMEAVQQSTSHDVQMSHNSGPSIQPWLIFSERKFLVRLLSSRLVSHIRVRVWAFVRTSAFFHRMRCCFLHSQHFCCEMVTFAVKTEDTERNGEERK